jgi:hypothetical protein
MRSLIFFGALLIATIAVAQTQKAGDVAPFISIDAPVLVLNHVRVIDGTGAAAVEDQAVVISDGKILSIGAAGAAQIPQGAQVLDRSGYSVMPGIVGMHDHHLLHGFDFGAGCWRKDCRAGIVCGGDSLFGAATLFCCGRDYYAYDRELGALHGFEN